ncbi:hypothetical protein N7522_001367 [Penicillium canescens]|uniref:HNH nuclease domain-containing protein n=1 Tax=Penicillium canescens TaxID=5083 RepID=A0AAD6IQY7_PENCN|nr:hypothetical protein N7522_001367 [Penicillium canescens]KAJ6057539.1 hypothetical protein N7460_000813 [Penicillium canescens]
MTRVLEEPRIREHNVRLYDNNGTLLASLQINPLQRHLTHEMLYRYCSMIFIIPGHQTWAIFPILHDESPGRVLRSDRQTPIKPGNYLVLDDGKHAKSRASQHRAVSPPKIPALGLKDNVKEIICGLHASHIFPTSQIAQWERENYQRYITDPSPASKIGSSKLYSPQNGLLLGPEAHEAFDKFKVGVDPDAGYKIIIFGKDSKGLGGTRLRDSARDGTDQKNGVSANLLRWHLRMCVYRNMKANAEPQPLWDEDLGEDNMGQILEQHDAAERMEVELFTRLGSFVA